MLLSVVLIAADDYALAATREDTRVENWIITWMSGESFIRDDRDSVWNTLRNDRLIRPGNIVRTGEKGRLVLKGDGLFIKVGESTTISNEAGRMMTMTGGAAWFYARERTDLRIRDRRLVLEDASAVVEVDAEVITTVSVMEGRAFIDGRHEVNEGQRARLVKGRDDPAMTVFVPRHVKSSWDDFLDTAMEETMALNVYGVQVISSGLTPGLGAESLPIDEIPDMAFEDLIRGRTPPVIVLDLPAPGATVGPEFRVRGTVPSPGVKGVDIYLDNTWLRSVALLNNRFDTIVDLSRSHGPAVQLEIRAMDISGVPGSLRRELRVDIHPPVITLAPVIVDGSRMQRIRGFVDDPHVSEITLYVNRNTRDQRRYHVPVFGFSFEVEVLLREGVNIIHAEATDKVGNIGVERRALRFSPGAFQSIY